MKKLFACVLSIVACMCAFASCSANDGKVDDKASSRDVSSMKASEKAESSRIDSSLFESSSMLDSSSYDDSDHDNLGEDIKDGIDNGMDTAQSIVDDIIR